MEAKSHENDELVILSLFCSYFPCFQLYQVSIKVDDLERTELNSGSVAKLEKAESE